MNHLTNYEWSPMSCVYRFKSSIRSKLSESNMYVKKWWILEELSMAVRHNKWPSAFAYDEMKNEMMKWTIKW